MCLGDGSDTGGRDMQGWCDADIRWVTDELAQHIKAATTVPASDADHEPSVTTDVPAHASLSQTVQFVASVFVSTNRYCVIFCSCCMWKSSNKLNA